MIPRIPTLEMIAAAKKAVSGFPRDAAIEAIWQAMWDAAQADRNPEGHDPAEGHGAEHESPVAASSNPKGLEHE